MSQYLLGLQEALDCELKFLTLRYCDVTFSPSTSVWMAMLLCNKGSLINRKEHREVIKH